MGKRRGLIPLAVVAAACALPAGALAHGPEQHSSSGHGAGLTSGHDAFQNFALKGASPYTAATSSDIAFWGDQAFVGNYNGFRVFDISGGAPKLLADVNCPGAQGDPSVWDRNEDGTADLVILSVDRTMANPNCGAAPVAHDDPSGWEGLRIFDVSNLSNITQVATVYQDCGSHTNTLVPRPGENRLLVLNSSYPLRPGPTCGPVRGPQAGRDALHGTVQVVEVPLGNPAAAREVTELPITYPGDQDNNYLPVSEQGLPGNIGLVDGMRACHDIAVFLEAGLVGAACAEQAQVWRLDPATGLPDTANPLWVYDQDNVDFWHSATFSWDGQVVNFIDESFGAGCPTTTVKKGNGGTGTREFQSGNMYFMNARSGELYNEFRIPRGSQPIDHLYCSSHLGNTVPSKDRYLLANAYYDAGSSVIDFTNPRKPREVAYADRDQAGTWSTYWYENGRRQKKETLDIYSNDGVPARPASNGFEAWEVTIGAVKRSGLTHLNPQVQEEIVKSQVSVEKPGNGPKARNAKRGTVKRFNAGKYAKGKKTTKARTVNVEAADHLATR